MLGRVGLLLAVLAAWPVDVRAEILVAPFVGGAFAGQTTLPLFGLQPADPSAALSKSLVIGVAGLWLGPGILGVEGEVASAPGFFELGDGRPAFVSSNFTTVSGSLVVTAPLSVTRESLRPYVVGGLGLLHVGVDDLLGFEHGRPEPAGLEPGRRRDRHAERPRRDPVRPPPYPQRPGRPGARRRAQSRVTAQLSGARRSG